MQTSYIFSKPNVHSYGLKFNLAKDSIKISHRQIQSINSDNFKNATTRPISRHSLRENTQNQQRHNETAIQKDLLERIRMKSEAENTQPKSIKSTPKKHKSFSSYITRMVNNRKHQKELTVCRSLSKNIKEMKVQKCKTQVGFNKNLRTNDTENRKTQPHLSQRKYEVFPDFKGTLIVLGMKKRKEAELKAEEQELMAQSISVPHAISGWNSKFSPPKKFNTVILEKICKDEWPSYSPETQQKADEELIKFVRSSKLSLKKRPSFIQQKLSKTLIN